MPLLLCSLPRPPDFPVRFQSFDHRLRTIEADSRTTQEGLKACMDEIGGALDYLRNRVNGDRTDTGDRSIE